tara:strand:+ start:54212 stop:54397 length:186 start_codon:yes stop_codon:yes gene_type:complete
MTTDRETRRQLRDQEKKIADLEVLVDTLQACLRRAEVVLKNHNEYDYVFAQSAKWAMKEQI